MGVWAVMVKVRPIENACASSQSLFKILGENDAFKLGGSRSKDDV